MMKRLALALALLFAAVSANGGEPFPRYGNDLDRGYRVPMEIDRLAALLGDEVLRDMVCRLAHERYAFGNLSLALGVPEGQVMRRINTLRGWGLVRTVSGDHTIVEPIPGDGARTMRRWADRYCSTGDACANPAANPDNEKNGRKEAPVAGAGIASVVGGDPVLKGKVVTVFGGSGFIGIDLVRRLVAAGANVRVAVRNPANLLFMKTERGLRQISGLTVNVGDKREVMSAVAGASMVVNLVGILNETGEQKFTNINENGPRSIAEAAAEAKVERLVQVSAISADPESVSVYARSKAAGEAAAREKFPNVTIVRPGLVFDLDGGFVKRLADMARYTPVMPIFGGGKAKIQPVYLGDVSAAIVRILTDPGTGGQTYELGGPRTMTMREIVTIVMRETGHKRPLVPLPMWLAEAQARLLRWLPNQPLTRDHVTLLRKDNVVASDALGLADLGLTPTPIEDILSAKRDQGDGKSKPAY